MREKLVILLNDGQLSWATLSSAGGVLQSVTAGNPDDLKAIAHDKFIIVVVPAVDVLLTAVMMPRLSPHKLREALPYALEEQVISDIEKLHFALAPQKEDGNVPVAVVDKVKMQAWIKTLADLAIHPDIMMPITYVLKNKGHGLIADVAVIRLDEYRGITLDLPNLPSVLSFVNAADIPNELHIDNFTHEAVKAQLEPLLPVTETLHEQKELIRFIAKHADQAPINLLQNQFAVKKSKLPKMNRLWQFAAGLTAACLLLWLIYPAVSYVMLHHRLSQLDEGIASIYRKHFPQSSSIVAPKTRLQDKLQSLASGSGGNHLFLQLAELGNALKKSNGIKLIRIDYQGNQLSAQLTAPSSDELTALTNTLTNRGLTVNGQNAVFSGNRINATLVIE